MEKLSAIAALSALAQESRMDAFRRLVRRGAEGMAAGEIARAVGVPHNTMSAHLAILANAGLVMSRREGRSIVYAVDFGRVRGLLAFLLEDCCRGKPEDCAPLIARVLPQCCVQGSRA